MKAVLVRRALGLLTVSLLATACTSGAQSTRSTTTSRARTSTAPTTELGSLVADVTPTGWVPVDFGEAQVSVPATWSIGYDVGCPTGSGAGGIFVGSANSTCPATAGSGFASTVMIGWGAVAPAPGSRPATINGIAVRRQALEQETTYVVSELGGVQITVRGTVAKQVIRTLTHSPADVVLATGPAPAVPRSWTWIPGGSVSFAVPASWGTRDSDVRGPLCGGGPLSPDTVTTDYDTYDGLGASCPAPMGQARQTPVAPEDGVVVDLRATPTFGWPPSTKLGTCLHLGGITACLYDRTLTQASDQMAELDILFVKASVPGHADEILEIGLAGNGMVARTILYSLRPA